MIFSSFGTILAHYWRFFLNDLPNQFESNLSIFFMFFWSIWPTGWQILRQPSFSLTFLLVKKWHFMQFWHISSTYWRIFSEWVSKSFQGWFNLLLPIFAVNLIYWRANFEIAILFFDFSLVSKNGILGNFGTFLADIGGFFLNEVTKHFRSNLLFSFVFLQSTWPTREEFLYSLSFCFTFYWFKK